MTSVLELTGWLDKQRRAYHKHDGFPEHPVRVLNHAEYFAGKQATPQVSRVVEQQTNWNDVLERSGPQLGSNPGGIFSDKNTGKRFYVKYGNDEQNAVEHLANTLYSELGVTVPNMEIIDFQGDRALKSEWLEGAKSDSSGQSHMASDEVRDNFAIDAWLSNWDVAGMGHDNIVEHDGKMYRIDTGGALYKRARGGDKPSFYSPEVGEIDTLRDSQMNPASAKVFSRVTDEDIRYGVGLLAEIDNDRINELVQQSHLPDEEKDRVATALIARKKNLLDRFGVTPIDKGWIGKQRRAYHKHDGFPEHPVRVKHHQEYFASHAAEPDQPSADVPKKDIADIQAEIQNLLARGMKNHQDEKWTQGDSDPFQGYAPEDMVLGWNLGDKQWVEDKISILGEWFDKILSDEDFSQLLQGLENSYSPERESLESERDRLREIIDRVAVSPSPGDETEEEEDLRRATRNGATSDYYDVMGKIDEINDKERFFKEVVLGTRPIPLLMDNIDTLVNSDKWYMNEIAFDLMKVDPTADFLMDVVNNEDFNFEVRTKALLALDAKRFDEVMRERYGSDWLAIEDWREDFKMGDVRGEVLTKQRKVKELHKAFGRDAVNHFIEHLEFPDDVQFDLEDTFNVMKKDPGRKARELFIELYDNTTFGLLHKTSMVQWEQSSSSDWGGLLKESIGRQLDGDIVHHTGPTISQLQEQYFPSRPQRLSEVSKYDVTIDYVTTQDHLDAYVLTHKKAIRKLLDSVYQDQDYIPVYRGTGRGGEVEEATELKDFKMDEWNPIAVTANPLSSYSLDVAVAHKFSKKTNGWMISSLVSKDDIWSNFWAHSYNGNEREFLLINKERESMGMQSDVWEVSITNKSPLASDYNSYGFKGTEDAEYSIVEADKPVLEDAANSIAMDFIPGNPPMQLSVAGHKKNFSTLNTYLNTLMEHDNMPASKALEFWNNAIKDSGWKKNPKLQDDPDFLSLPTHVKDLTEALEKKAGKEKSQTTPEINASKTVEGKDYSVKDLISEDFSNVDYPGAKENKFNPNWYAENFLNEEDFAQKVIAHLQEKGIYTFTDTQQLYQEVKDTKELLVQPIWDWVQENLNNEESGVTKSQWISKQSSRTMLVPYRTMVHRPAKTPYFATRWRKVSVPQRTGTVYNVIPIDEYKGDIQDIYSSWQGYVGDREEGRHDLYLPIISLQEIIYKGFDGLLATFNNRIVGVVSLHINQAKEARLSILSASPFDIIQGTENRIEDMLRRGVEIYVKNKGWDYIGIDDHSHREGDGEDVDIDKQRGQLIPVKVPITLPSGKKTEAIRWKKGKSDPKAFADFDDVFEALKDDPKMKDYLEAVVKKVPATWQRETLELDMSTDNNVIARAINSFGKWSYIRSTEKDSEIEEAKHDKVGKFTKALPKIRKDIERGLKKGDEEAFILHLIDVAGLRIGDEPDSGEAFDRTSGKDEEGNFPRVPTYAARQLLGKHVSVDGTKVRLQYPAKDNVPIDKTIDNALLAKFFSDKKKKVGDDDKLFEPSASKVRTYLQKLGGRNEFKIHNFRHYHANRLVIDKLKGYPMPTVDREEISKAVRREEIKQFKEKGRKKLSQSDRKAVVADYVAKQFRKHQLIIAEASAEFLAHTPAISLGKYIMPAVWSEWEKEQGKIIREHMSTPEPEPKKVRKIKRTVKKQDDYNPDEYQPWEDIDDFFERTTYDEESGLEEDADIFPEDEEEREAQDKEEEESDEGWQYPVDLSKAVTAENISQAKAAGLVPQSGNWQKPKRWVRPKDADVPVEEKSELTKLPEDTWKYFEEVPGTILVDIDKLIPSHVRPEGIIEANKRMQSDSRRKPLDLKDNGDGTYTILDGNSTYANAIDSEWKQLPGVVVEKPRKKAIISDDLLDDLEDMDSIISTALKEFPYIELEAFAEIYSTSLEGFSTKIVDIMGESEDGDIEMEIHILNEEGFSVGEMSRTFKEEDGKLSVHHNSFMLNEDYQGEGIATDIMEHVEEEYEKLGVSEIQLHANADIGGYAWSRQGYDFSTKNELEEMQDMFSFNIEKGDRVFENEEELIDQVHRFTHSWQFAAWNPTNEPHGKHFGKRWMLGTSWHAKKTLDKKSKGYKIGKGYFAAKRNEKNTA